MSAVGRNDERTVNYELAAVLRRPYRMKAEAERWVDNRSPDIVITRDDDSQIILETEFLPARTVDADARARVQTPNAYTADDKARVVFAVKMSDELKDAPQDDLDQLITKVNYQWQEWRAVKVSNGNGNGNGNGRYELVSSNLDIGTLADLVKAIKTAEEEYYELENALDILERGTKFSSKALNPASVSKIAKQVFGQKNYKAGREYDEVAQMSALIVINALVFHDRLLTHPKLPKLKHLRLLTDVSSFLDEWESILKIDYDSIFRLAYDILVTISGQESIDFLGKAKRTATDLIASGATGKHDLAGKIFNRLVADREFVKAYYTQIPTATLLAGLALEPSLWPNMDWTDRKQLASFTAVDPACGTGTLLMAAYQQLKNNTKTKDDEFHRVMLEKVLHGYDVVSAAIHLTASTLAVSSPSISYKRMNLHVAPLGMYGKAARLGTLDYLTKDKLQASFSAQSESVEAQGAGKNQMIPMPRADLVIANPPYTRFGSGAGGFDSRIFGQFEEQYRSLSAAFSKLIKDISATQIAGLASAFIALAGKMVKPDGRIAFVLPNTVTTGTSWEQVRVILSTEYELEFVISVHSPARRSRSQAISHDTGIGEILLIARRLKAGEESTKQTCFVNLHTYPQSRTEAMQIVREIVAKRKQAKLIKDKLRGGTVLGKKYIDKRWGYTPKHGEIVRVSIDETTWGKFMWHTGSLGQFVHNIYERGRLYSMDSGNLVTKLPIEPLESIVKLSPYHLQIKGTQGKFDITDGYSKTDHFPAMWHLESDRQTAMKLEPNAYLEPKSAETDYESVWQTASNIQIAPEVHYPSQRVRAAYTDRKTLGVRSWFSLNFRETQYSENASYGYALILWLNSTLGICCHLAHAIHSQKGRGTLSVINLKSLPVLDVRTLNAEQLAAANALWQDMAETEFQPFYLCETDAARQTLDARFLTEVLGCTDAAVQSVARIRELLTLEPKFNGGRQPKPKPTP